MSDLIYVPGSGPRDSKVMFIAEAPGADEEKQGTPLIGYSGQIFRESLTSAGIDPTKVYLTNVCHYRPPGNDIDKFFLNKKKRIPNELISKGLAELYRDIHSINPHLLVPMGNVALWALTGMMSITKRRGSIFRTSLTESRVIYASPFFKNADEGIEALSNFPGRKCIPTFHPAFVSRQWGMKSIFDLDLQKISEEMKSPKVTLPERIYYIDPSPEKALELAQILINQGRFSADLECLGTRMYCAQFCCDPKWALVLTTPGGYRELIKALMESETEKTFHNGTFDVSFLRQHENIHVKNYKHDTMFAWHTCYLEYPKALDFLTSILTKEPYYKDERKDWTKKILKRSRKFHEYAAKDAIVTEESMQSLLGEELKDPVYWKTYRFMMEKTPIVNDIQCRGLKVDLVYRTELDEVYSAEQKRLQLIIDDQALLDIAAYYEKAKTPIKKDKALDFLKKVYEKYGSDKGGLNVAATADLQYYLYEILGLPKKYAKRKKKNVEGETETQTADEKALKELYAETGNEKLLEIVTLKKIRKALGSYIRSKLGPDNRLYFTINIAATKTARHGSGKTIQKWGFNVITIPRQDNAPKGLKEYPIRRMILPDTGYIFAYFDLSQAEDRILAFGWGIQKKINAYLTGVDTHKLTASLIFGKSINEIPGGDNPFRYLGKMSNHAFNYEMGPFTFYDYVNKRADETGVRITRSDAKLFRTRHLTAYPELEYYWQDTRSKLRNGRTLINAHERKRVFRGRLDDTTFRDAYSWYPQSSVPDHVDRAMIKIYNTMPEVQIGIQYHDALLIMLPEKNYQDYIPEIKQQMEQPMVVNGTEIIIPCDCKVGENFHDLKKIAA